MNIHEKFCKQEGLTPLENQIAKQIAEQFVINKWITEIQSMDCDCQECGRYNIGDSRCDCGNVRISMSVKFTQEMSGHIDAYISCETH